MLIYRSALVFAGLVLITGSALAADAFRNYGAQHRANITQPSQATVDAAVRSRSESEEDQHREDILQQRSDYIDQHGYDAGHRAEAGDRFRYGADRSADDYSRANAQERFPVDTRPGIDRSGNVRYPATGSSSYSGTSSTTSTTTINQSRSIDASGNIIR